MIDWFFVINLNLNFDETIFYISIFIILEETKYEYWHGYYLSNGENQYEDKRRKY